MNKAEKKILRRVIHEVTHHNKHVRWELKREIFDGGYQTYYHWQREFVDAARVALESLSPSERDALIEEWRKKSPGRAELVIPKSYPAMFSSLLRRWLSALGRPPTERSRGDWGGRPAALRCQSLSKSPINSDRVRRASAE